MPSAKGTDDDAGAAGEKKLGIDIDEKEAAAAPAAAEEEADGSPPNAAEGC